jgi:5,10-methylenetetrahydrofolate reductase
MAGHRGWALHADELVELIRGLGDFTIGVAAFPDIHPSSPGLDHDIEVLVRKADAGASFAVTQMVFDADTYLRLRDAVAARRDLPVTPGLMPVTNLRQIQRMSQLMGTPLPAAVVSRLEAVGEDAAAVRAVGGDRHGVGSADARRGRAGAALHHDEPVDRDPRGAPQPRVGLGHVARLSQMPQADACRGDAPGQTTSTGVPAVIVSRSS